MKKIIHGEFASKRTPKVILPNNETPSTSPQILIVDDNEINQKLIARVIDDFNVKVSFANNGEEAVRLRKKIYLI